MIEEELHLHVHFGHIQRHVLLLDDPQMPLITVEANASYNILFERTWCEPYGVERLIQAMEFWMTPLPAKEDKSG